MDADVNSLWFFDVARRQILEDPVLASVFVARQASKTFKFMEPAETEAFLEEITLAEWVDLGQNCGLCIVVPSAFTELAKAGVRLAVPPLYSKGHFRTPGWFQSMLSPDLLNYFNSTKTGLHQVEDCPVFDVSKLDDLAANLRQVSQGTLPVETLVPWIAGIQGLLDSTQSSRLRRHGWTDLVRMLMYSDLLKNSDRLKLAIHNACRLLFPKELCEGLLKLCSQHKIIPSSATLSRFRLCFDVGMMLRERLKNHEAHRTGKAQWLYLVWDSSPQYHRDYELAFLESVAKRDTPKLMRLLEEIALDAASDDLLASLELQDKHKRDLEAATALIHRHNLPAVMIGFGNASFAHKFGALCHALRLERFSGEELAEAIQDGLVEVLSDDGTESVLNRVKPVDVAAVCPYFEDTTNGDIDLIKERVGKLRQAGHDEARREEPSDDFGDGLGFNMENGAGADSDDFGEPPQLNFLKCLGFSGVHHRLDNATKGLGNVLQHWDDGVSKSKVVCKMIRRTDTLQKLLARCFSGRLGANLHDRLKSFKGWIWEERWGTIAFSIPEIVKIKPVIVWGWDLNQFVQGDQDENDAHEVSELARVFDEAVGDPFYWSWLIMADNAIKPIRSLISWHDSCGCHAKILKKIADDDDIGELGADKSFVKAIMKCPLRGRRAPEMSAGEEMTVFDAQWQTSVAELSAELPPVAVLPAAKRLSLLQDMDMAHAHLTFYLTAKSSYEREEPWSVTQVAHLDRTIREGALQRCLDSRHEHHLLRWPHCLARSFKLQTCILET